MLFSQRRGLTPVKSLIQVDTVDGELRNALWTAITVWHDQHTIPSRRNDFSGLMQVFWLYYFKQPLDQYSNEDYVYRKIRESFFGGEWFRCYDILEFLIANYPDGKLKSDLIEHCNFALETELSGYRIVGEQISPITSDEEISSIEAALTDTDALRPVNEHIATALNYLSDRSSPDYRNSIKESISAVESLCNLITGGKDTLGEALNKLESKVTIHPALKKGFSCIYGYTSDTGGIRHALLDEPTLDFEDAKYMLVSCSTFINYLIAKATKAGIEL